MSVFDTWIQTNLFYIRIEQMSASCRSSNSSNDLKKVECHSDLLALLWQIIFYKQYPHPYSINEDNFGEEISG